MGGAASNDQLVMRARKSGSKTLRLWQLYMTNKHFPTSSRPLRTLPGIRHLNMVVTPETLKKGPRNLSTTLPTGLDTFFESDSKTILTPP